MILGCLRRLTELQLLPIDLMKSLTINSLLLFTCKSKHFRKLKNHDYLVISKFQSKVYQWYLADTWLNYAENGMKIRKKIMVKIMIMAILKIRKIIKPQLLSQGWLVGRVTWTARIDKRFKVRLGCPRLSWLPPG